MPGEKFSPEDFAVQQFFNRHLNPQPGKTLGFDPVTGELGFSPVVGIPTTITSTLAEDVTITTDGSKILEVTASESGLYIAEVAFGGVVYWGAGPTYFDGSLMGRVIADLVGEADQTNFTTNFKTFAGVTGLPIYERTHATPNYATGIDLFWRSMNQQNNTYDGTANGGTSGLSYTLTQVVR